MEKITVKDFEEMIIRDEALTAKVKEITGEGEEKKEKIAAFAASLGYEIDFGGETREFSPHEMENAAGGLHLTGHSTYSYCKAGGDHQYVEISREKGIIFNTIYYRCAKCGKEKKNDWAFPWQ